MIVDMEQLPAPANVHFVMPYYKRPSVFALRARDRQGALPLAARVPGLWATALLRGRGVTVDMIFLFEVDPLEPAPGPWLSADRTPPQLNVPRELRCLPRLDVGAAVTEGAAIVIPVNRLVRATGESTYFYFHDGNRGQLIHLEAPDRPR